MSNNMESKSCNNCGSQLPLYESHQSICSHCRSDIESRKQNNAPAYGRAGSSKPPQSIQSKSAFGSNKPLESNNNASNFRQSRFNTGTSGSQNRGQSTAAPRLNNKIQQVQQNQGRQNTDYNLLLSQQKSSYEIQRFGLENHAGHLNCFLNASLQSLWNLSPIAISLKFYSKEDESQDMKVSKISSVISPIKELFRVIDQGGSSLVTKIFCANVIRRELFKMFYFTNQFNLNEKADANEALDTILSIIHAIKTKNLGQNEKGELDLDEACKDCFVHENFQLNLNISKLCSCGKDFPKQSQHVNNFSFIVNIESFVKICDAEMSGDNIASRAYSYITSSSFLKIQHKFHSIVKQSYEASEDICILPQCTIRDTKTRIEISGPYPNIISLNLNYTNPGIDPLSLMKILVSIPDKFYLRDLFETFDKSEYEFKGMINYMGAHYFSYFRILESDDEYNPPLQQRKAYDYKIGQWYIFDDDQVQEVQDWKTLVTQCVEAGIKPTTLFFQKVSEEVKQQNRYGSRSMNVDELKIDKYELQSMERNAKELSEQMSDLYNVDTIREQERMFSQYKEQKSGSGKQENQELAPMRNQQPMESQNPPDGKDQPAEEVVTDRNQIKREIKKCITKIKEIYHKEGVYIFKCNKCLRYMMLNQESCPNQKCLARNYFFDEKLEVASRIEDQVMSQLENIYIDAQLRKNLLEYTSQPSSNQRVGEDTQESTKSQVVDSITNEVNQLIPITPKPTEVKQFRVLKKGNGKVRLTAEDPSIPEESKIEPISHNIKAIFSNTSQSNQIEQVIRAQQRLQTPIQNVSNQEPDKVTAGESDYVTPGQFPVQPQREEGQQQQQNNGGAFQWKCPYQQCGQINDSDYCSKCVYSIRWYDGPIDEIIVKEEPVKIPDEQQIGSLREQQPSAEVENRSNRTSSGQVKSKQVINRVQEAPRNVTSSPEPSKQPETLIWGCPFCVTNQLMIDSPYCSKCDRELARFSPEYQIEAIQKGYELQERKQMMASLESQSQLQSNKDKQLLNDHIHSPRRPNNDLQIPQQQSQKSLDNQHRQRKSQQKQNSISMPQFLIKPVEEIPLTENDWKCEDCRYINTFDYNDAASARCKQCFVYNKNIQEMIYIAKGQEQQQLRIQSKIDYSVCSKCNKRWFDYKSNKCINCLYDIKPLDISHIGKSNDFAPSMKTPQNQYPSSQQNNNTQSPYSYHYLVCLYCKQDRYYISLEYCFNCQKKYPKEQYNSKVQEPEEKNDYTLESYQNNKQRLQEQEEVRIGSPQYRLNQRNYQQSLTQNRQEETKTQQIIRDLDSKIVRNPQKVKHTQSQIAIKGQIYKNCQKCDYPNYPDKSKCERCNSSFTVDSFNPRGSLKSHEVSGNVSREQIIKCKTCKRRIDLKEVEVDQFKKVACPHCQMKNLVP